MIKIARTDHSIQPIAAVGATATRSTIGPRQSQGGTLKKSRPQKIPILERHWWSWVDWENIAQGFWQKIQATRSQSSPIWTKQDNIRAGKTKISTKHIGTILVPFILFSTHIKKGDLSNILYFFSSLYLANISSSIHWIWQPNQSIIQTAWPVQSMPVAPVGPTETIDGCRLSEPGCQPGEPE